jgi:hypothetical protein
LLFRQIHGLAIKSFCFQFKNRILFSATRS